MSFRLLPLRERKDDIPLLIRHFFLKFGPSLNKSVKGLTPEAQQLLLMYQYPGNIRELENIIKRALVIAEGSLITPKNLPDHIQVRSKAEKSVDFDLTATVSKDYAAYKEIKAQARKRLEEHLDTQFIMDLLKENNGNVSLAARKANMNRSLLHQMIQRYNLDTYQYRSKTGNC